MNRFLLLACLLASTSFVTSARAGFEWVPPTQSAEAPSFAEPIPVPDKAMESTNQTLGVIPMPPESMTAEKEPAPMPVSAPKPRDPNMVEGFGRDIPLTIATRQVVPSNYAIQYGQGVDPSASVSWQGGQDWKSVLNEALSGQNLKATIVADSVLIESVAPPQELTPEPLPTPIVEAPKMEEVVVADLMPPAMPQATVEPTAPSAPAVQMWIAPKSSTLRQVLSDWSKAAGVQLQWSAQYDYPLMSEAQISGSYEDAVETLLAGLVDAQPRPVARLHPNEPSGPAILIVETRHIME